MTDKLSLLAVFAHPDDESCGPGATLAMYAHRGVHVSLVTITSGELGAWGTDQTIPVHKFGLERMLELQCACKSLGIRRWAVLGYADGAAEEWGRRKLEKELTFWIRRVQPQVVVTHYPEGANGHPDHNAVSRAVTQAHLGAGRMGRFRPSDRGGLPPWQPLKLYYSLPQASALAPKSRGHWAVIVADRSSVEAKIQALRCHASQEACWGPMAERLRHSAKWEETFYLAHSRLSWPRGPESDLFAGAELAGTLEAG